MKTKLIPFAQRYVVTHLGKDGRRTLAHACQGRNTYATREEAQQWIDDATANNGDLSQYYGLPLAVRSVACWPDHFDPVSIYPEEA